MSWYCAVAPGHPWHQPYHDLEYGVPVCEDRVLFERLCLEIFQAGLSWEIILRRRTGLVAAFEGFEPAMVAALSEMDQERLLTDTRIIRNRRKVAAVVENARRWQKLGEEWGGMAQWLAAHHPRDRAGWIKLFRQTFLFMGPEVVAEFLLSIGYLPGAHAPDCPVGMRLLAACPPLPWRTAEEAGFAGYSSA
jgi:DNA-3-methyladenine glycosylase I